MVTPYLAKQDLQSSIRDGRLEHLLDNTDENTPDVFNQAASEAQSIVKDYLIRYAIEEELEKDGEDRHPSIIFYLKNLCLYILYERIEDDDVPERIIKNYNDTMETLRDIAQGKIPLSLPFKQKDTDGDGEPDSVKTKFRWGTNPLREY